MADTLQNAAGMRVAKLGILEDVDEAHELAGFAGWSGRVILPVHFSPPSTTIQPRQAADNSNHSC